MNGYQITEACIGCTACAKSCPVKAISGEPKAKHVIDVEKCIACGLCGRICPKGAVLDPSGAVTERLLKSEWPKPQVYSELCIGCSVCIENCPKDCLDLVKARRPELSDEAASLVKADACIGCGICESVCPAGAIMMRSPNGDPYDQPGKGEERGMANKAYVGYCRTFQAGMKVGNYFLGYRTPKFISGAGALDRLPDMLVRGHIDNILFVTDQGLMKLHLPDKLLRALEENGITCTVYSDVAPNPTSDNVEEGFALYDDNACEAIIAMGGGSPMDCAKAIAAKAVHPKKSVRQLQGLLKVHKRIPTIFAIPTTAGTGSETTVAAVITDSETHRKASINDPVIIPKYAVLDPDLTVGLPPFVTATTGLDALCHAVEAYTNHTYNTKLENRLAKKAVRLIYQNLETAYRDGSDKKARENMQKAAFFAGRAFTRGCVGYVHAIGHTLGGLYGVAHGLAMSIILPHVMRAFGPAVYDRLADLADVCGMEGETSEEKAMAFIGWIEEMKKKMDIPVGLDMIKDEDVDQIITWAMKEANPLYPVPVIWGRRQFEDVIDTMRAVES